MVNFTSSTWLEVRRYDQTQIKLNLNYFEHVNQVLVTDAVPNNCDRFSRAKFIICKTSVYRCFIRTRKTDGVSLGYRFKELNYGNEEGSRR